ncbi:MAG: Acetyltransferase protein [Gemmatimonadetes bacterium]|nr:Acetyltransferase protein [Gemmatimonadota bacterium]
MTGTFRATLANTDDVAELARCYPASVFLSAGYLNAMRATGQEIWIFGVRGEDGTVQAACGGLLKTGRLNTTLEIPSLPNVEGSSPFWAGLQTFWEDKHVTILDLGSFGSPAGTRLPELPAVRGRRQRREFVLSLGGNAPLGVSSNHRRNIRRAEKAGVHVTRTHAPNAAAVHLSLMKHSVHRRRLRGEHIQMSEASAELRAFLDAGAGELFQAVRGNDVLSSVLILRSKSGAYYRSAGTSTEGMLVGASHLLVHSIARQLEAEGVQQFNLGGADDGSSLARFKMGFGAARIDLEASASYIGPPWRRRVSRAVELLRNDRPALRSLLIGDISRIIVFEQRLGDTPRADARPDLELRFLSSDEVRAIAVDDGAFESRQLARLKRFGQSHAYGLFVEGELAHVAWLLPPNATARDDPRVWLAHHGEVEITACETLPRFRGRGYFPLAIRKLTEIARAQGTKRIIMKTSAANVAAQSGIQKAGFGRIGLALFITLPVSQRRVVVRLFS